MYDKVKIWMDRAMVGEQYPTIVNYLDEANTQINHQTGEVKTFGCLGGLKVSIFVGGLSVMGSLAKVLYPNNIYPLDMNSTAQAIEKLSDKLHLSITNAKVTGLEFGRVFVMAHPVEKYLSKLGDLSRLSRYHFGVGTLYYKPRGKQQHKVLAFYDKKADAAAKGMVLPVGFENANLLKYEMRFNGRLSQQMGGDDVKASTLYESGFYRQMIKRYQDNYFAISKLNQVKTDVMSEIKTVSDAFNVLMARLINGSDQMQITAFLEELKESRVFDDRKNYTRLKRKIQEVATKAEVTTSDELIKELDDEIKNVGAYI